MIAFPRYSSAMVMGGAQGGREHNSEVEHHREQTTSEPTSASSKCFLKKVREIRLEQDFRRARNDTW